MCFLAFPKQHNEMYINCACLMIHIFQKKINEILRTRAKVAKVKNPPGGRVATGGSFLCPKTLAFLLPVQREMHGMSFVRPLEHSWSLIENSQNSETLCYNLHIFMFIKVYILPLKLTESGFFHPFLRFSF